MNNLNHGGYYNGITYEVETITPEQAKDWLKYNTHNRGKKRSNLESYSRDMEAASWLLTFDPIRFAEDGTLIDGQHRLEACMRSKQNIDALVVRNLGFAVQSVIDTGKGRSASDALTLDNEKYSNVLASCLRYLYWIKSGSERRQPTNMEIKQLLKQHPHARDSAARAGRVRNSIVPVGILACVHYIGSVLLNLPDVAERYLSTIETGVPSYPGDPVHAYREKLIKEKMSLRPGLVQHVRSKLSGAIHAWNLSARHASVKSFRTPEGSVSFDRINVSKL